MRRRSLRRRFCGTSRRRSQRGNAEDAERSRRKPNPSSPFRAYDLLEVIFMSTAAGAQQDLVAVRAMNAEFGRLANAGDAGALVDFFYAEEASLLPPGAPLVKG